jgi:hypothetical protein
MICLGTRIYALLSISGTEGTDPYAQHQLGYPVDWLAVIGTFRWNSVVMIEEDGSRHGHAHQIRWLPSTDNALNTAMEAYDSAGISDGNHFKMHGHRRM